MTGTRAVGGALVWGTVLAGWIALQTGAIGPAAYDGLFVAAVCVALWTLGAPRSAAIAGTLAGALVLAAAHRWPGIRIAPFLPVAVANLAVAGVFARGLLPGRTPIILQLVRHMGIGPAETPDFRRFVRGQCVVWAVLGGATGLAALAALPSPELRPVLAPVIAALLALQLAWFVLSHRYANARHGRPETWRDTLAAMIRPGTWRALEI